MRTLYDIGLYLDFSDDVLDILERLDNAIDSDDDAEIERLENIMKRKYSRQWQRIEDYTDGESDALFEAIFRKLGLNCR